MEKTLDSLEENIELMIENSCPQEAEGIINKIFPTHCDGLVAIETVNDQIFVSNPTIEELVVLPFRTLYN
jgi:hypothetical protein